MTGSGSVDMLAENGRMKDGQRIENARKMHHFCRMWNMYGMKKARNHLHNCRGWKMQGMENGRKEKTGKCKEWKMLGNVTVAATKRAVKMALSL